MLVELIPTNGRKIGNRVESIMPATKRAFIELILIGCRGENSDDDDDDGDDDEGYDRNKPTVSSYQCCCQITTVFSALSATIDMKPFHHQPMQNPFIEIELSSFGSR